MAQLFDSLKLRDVVLNDRIARPPMCEYSAQDSVVAIQLAHAGRKAGVDLGWQLQRTLAANKKSAGFLATAEA